MSEENELPKGWVWTRVGEIYDIVGGGTPSTSIEEYWKGDIAWITSADIYDLKDIRPRKLITKAAIENSATNLVPEGSLIVVTRVGLGKVGLAKMPLCFSQDSQALIDDSFSIYPDYALYYLAQVVQVFKYQNRGTTIAGVTKKQLSELPFALPPLPEQHRIVAAIEQQFTRLDASVAALQRARTKLKRYRAAVLKAAVEGKLTEAWRAEHPTTEPASILLERILQERRAKWEADLRAKGKDPAKVRYVEPAGPDVEGLPEGWCWASLEQVSDESRAITYGVVKLGDPVVGGIPTLRSSNVRHLRFDLDGLKCISPTIANEYKRTFLQGGEILVTVRGTLGGVAVTPADFAGFNISREVAMIACILPCLAYCLALFISSPPIQSWMMQSAKGIAYTGINIETLKDASIPLPPLAEQEQIVAEVERRLSVISQLEATVEANLKRADRLRQSILREAFAGRLVPQDPNDEPASVLLERIRSERSEQSNGRKNGISTSKNSRGRAVKVPEPETVDVMGMEQAELWENVGN